MNPPVSTSPTMELSTISDQYTVTAVSKSKHTYETRFEVYVLPNRSLQCASFTGAVGAKSAVVFRTILVLAFLSLIIHHKYPVITGFVYCIGGNIGAE